MTDPHPPKSSIMNLTPMIFQSYSDDLCMLMKFISNSPVVHISTNTYPQLPNPTVVSISQNLVFALNRWNTTYNRNRLLDWDQTIITFRICFSSVECFGVIHHGGQSSWAKHSCRPAFNRWSFAGYRQSFSTARQETSRRRFRPEVGNQMV